MISVGEMILRIAVGGLLGAVIGLERHLRAKEAGIRTHFLVGLGSALFMVVSQFGFPGAERFDAARVAAQVVSGMGFLGAGLIIFHKNSVRGLTTAAGIWVVSAIGLACGAGLFWVAAAAVAMAVFCLEAMHFFLRRFEQHQIRLVCDVHSSLSVRDVLDRLGFEVAGYSIERQDDGNLQLDVVLKVTSRDSTDRLLTTVAAIDGLTVQKIEPVEE